MYNYDLWDEFFQKLSQLQKNRENVPVELLNGKYHKAYQKLQQETAALAGTVILDFILDGVSFEENEKDPKEAFIALARTVLAKEQAEGGIIYNAIKKVMQDYDHSEMFTAVLPVRKKIVLDLYAPYRFGFGMPHFENEEATGKEN